jgi:phage I-like protein
MTAAALPRTPRHLAAGSGAAADSLVLADGTIWSHAATLGTYIKGDQFTIGPEQVQNAVRVFTAGYPQKIPVDYSHALTSSDPEIRKLRAQGLAPKAGDVQELRAVLSTADFAGDIKAAAEKLSGQVGRSLDDPRNLGLWMRWKPTARALQAIRAGEYTELSITFDEDLPHNVDEKGQGFGLWAVALLNGPFLDGMLPVAASRTDDPPLATPATRENTMTTPNTKLLSLVAAVRGKPVSTDDEAIVELTGLQAELTELRAIRDYRAVVGAELEGEIDVTKVVAKIRQLKADNATAAAAAKDAKALSIKTTVDATIKEHEGRIGSVPLREMLTRQLTGELEANKKLEDTDTLKTIKSLPSAQSLGQRAAADPSGAGAADNDGERFNARVKELMASDPELKELTQKNGFSVAWREAGRRAEKELAAAKK